MTDCAKENPLVTFVVFAYNQENYIREAVAGAFAQTYEPLEIILSDDCSTDNTFTIMRELADKYKGPHSIKLRRNHENRGLAGHINTVVAEAHGTFISWAGGDDVASAFRTQKLITPMLENCNITAVHSALTLIDLDGNRVGERHHGKQKHNIRMKDVCKRGVSVVSQSHAFRSSVFEQFGPFNKELTNEGFALTFRELAQGRIHYIDEPLTKYRMGSGVSTYSGSDIYRVKSSEPIKIINWYRTSFKQMLKDSSKVENLTPKMIRDIQNNCDFYDNLYRVNRREEVLAPLLANARIRPFDLSTARAIFRTKSSPQIYIFLRRYFGKYKR